MSLPFSIITPLISPILPSVYTSVLFYTSYPAVRSQRVILKVLFVISTPNRTDAANKQRVHCYRLLCRCLSPSLLHWLHQYCLPSIPAYYSTHHIQQSAVRAASNKPYSSISVSARQTPITNPLLIHQLHIYYPSTPTMSKRKTDPYTYRMLVDVKSVDVFALMVW